MASNGQTLSTCHRFTLPIYPPKSISPMDKLCTSALSWKCKRQTTILKSSAEAEYWAMSSASDEVIRLHHLLLDFGVFSLRPKPLFADNTSAIQIANNPVFHERTNHIEVDCHFNRQHIMSKIYTSHMSLLNSNWQTYSPKLTRIFWPPN